MRVGSLYRGWSRDVQSQAISMVLLSFLMLSSHARDPDAKLLWLGTTFFVLSIPLALANAIPRLRDHAKRWAEFARWALLAGVIAGFAAAWSDAFALIATAPFLRHLIPWGGLFWFIMLFVGYFIEWRTREEG